MRCSTSLDALSRSGTAGIAGGIGRATSAQTERDGTTPRSAGGQARPSRRRSSSTTRDYSTPYPGNSANRRARTTPAPWQRPPRNKVGLTLINRIGVITLVLGVAFFFKWAVDNNWIGPAGRVILGLFAGLGTLAAGDLLWRKAQRAFAQGITGTGIAVLYLASYAAFGFYHLIPQALAFLLMCSVTVLAFALSLRYGSPSVTALGLFGGYLTPLALNNGEPHPWFLLSYIFLLDIAAMQLSKRRRWPVLESLSAVATALIYGGWIAKLPLHTGFFPATVALIAYYALFSRIYEPLLFVFAQPLVALSVAHIGSGNPGLFFPLALLFAAAGLAYAEIVPSPYMLSAAFASFWFAYALVSGPASVAAEFCGITAAFLLFYAWNVWILARHLQPPTAQRLSVVGFNGVVYYTAAYFLLSTNHHAWLGLLAVAVAAAYLAFGVLLYRQRTDSPENRPLLLALGMALAFATLAIPIQFTAFTVTVAWSLEAVLLSWIAWHLRTQYAAAVAVLLFALVTVRLLFLDQWMLPDTKTYSLFWNERFFTFIVASASFFLAARWVYHLSRTVALWEYFAGHTVLLWGLSLEVVAWAHRSLLAENALSAETLSLSILYALYALVLVSAGVATRTALNRIAGLILIGLVIGKLYLFDVWQLQRPFRISAFIALGILLISTSFLYSRFRNLIDSLLHDDETAS